MISKADTLLGTGCTVEGVPVIYCCITNYPKVGSLKECIITFHGFQQGWLGSARLLVFGGLSCSCSQIAAGAGHWRWELISGGGLGCVHCLSVWSGLPHSMVFQSSWTSHMAAPPLNERRSKVFMAIFNPPQEDSLRRSVYTAVLTMRSTSNENNSEEHFRQKPYPCSWAYFWSVRGTDTVHQPHFMCPLPQWGTPRSPITS